MRSERRGCIRLRCPFFKPKEVLLSQGLLSNSFMFSSSPRSHQTFASVVANVVHLAFLRALSAGCASRFLRNSIRMVSKKKPYFSIVDRTSPSRANLRNSYNPPKAGQVPELKIIGPPWKTASPFSPRPSTSPHQRFSAGSFTSTTQSQP